MASANKRSSCSYEPKWQRFTSFPHSLTKSISSNSHNPYQINGYSNLYRSRVAQYRKIFLSNDEGRHSIARIIDFVEGDQTNTTVLGTIIKTLSTPAPPISNFTDNGTNDNLLDGEEDIFTTQYCTDEDILFLEDESGRIQIHLKESCKINAVALVTGVVVAVTGIIKNGILDVESIECINIIESIDPSGTYMPSACRTDNSCEDNNILIVSGLNCGGLDENSSGCSTSLKREMLLDYISGHSGNIDEVAAMASTISRVIVIGSCAKPSVSLKSDDNWDECSLSKGSEKSNNRFEEITFPVKELDQFLSQVCAMGVAVDYIPGLNDATNANWPQMPLHPCLLSNAERFGSGCEPSLFYRCTNPYESNIAERLFLGSDGLNISDIRRFTAEKQCNKTKDELVDCKNMVTALTGLRSTLRFGHIAPTCPSSIPTFPFDNVDPFIIEKLPDVYFAGNCEKFETELVKCSRKTDAPESTIIVTRLICIPSFFETGQAVLLNLKSLSCNLLQFDDNTNAD